MFDVKIARIRTRLPAAAAMFIAAPAIGQLYQQNFQVNPAASWTLNGGPSDEAANFFFDYATVGIPTAPSAAGSRGMKLQANLSSGIFGGMSVSPTGQSFSGDYTLRFDWWANFNGPFPAGGSGSTMLSTFGVGTAGTVAQWPGGGPQDSVWFGATPDGNSSADWRAYSTAAPIAYSDTSGVFAAGAVAGSRNHTHPYYASFGGVAAPAAQLALFPQQTGTTHIGSAGMEWHRVAIMKRGGLVKWIVDGLLIATIDLDTVSLGGGNIFFGHSDTNSTSSTDPNDVNLLFTLIDNISVWCASDFNEDGSTTVADIFAMLGAWFTGDPTVDFDGSGGLGISDIFAYLAVWFAGCT